jgi:hypothetical protein
MPTTPHESIAGHRFSYNRLRASRGGGTRTRPIRLTPPRTAHSTHPSARPWPAHAAPRSSPLFAPRPRSTWVSLRTARQVVKPNVEELRAGLRTRITGQVRVRVMQAGQTRSCGARAHTHKHPRTEMPAVGSHATCAAALPSGSPPAPSSLSTQFRTVENCQPSNPTNFGLVFRSPRTLRVFGDLMSNISATRGRPDMRFCVCGSPSEDLSHIASLTIGCSR